MLLLKRESEEKISWLLPNGLDTGNACMKLINICMHGAFKLHVSEIYRLKRQRIIKE